MSKNNPRQSRNHAKMWDFLCCLVFMQAFLLGGHGHQSLRQSSSKMTRNLSMAGQAAQPSSLIATSKSQHEVLKTKIEDHSRPTARNARTLAYNASGRAHSINHFGSITGVLLARDLLSSWYGVLPYNTLCHSVAAARYVVAPPPIKAIRQLCI